MIRENSRSSVSVKLVVGALALITLTEPAWAVLGVCLDSREDEGSWSTFLRHLKERGLKGVRLVTSDKASGLVGLVGNFFPGASWQRCVVHFERNVLKDVPTNKAEEVARMLRAIFSQESREAALEKAANVSAKTLEQGIGETLSVSVFLLLPNM